MALAGIAIVLCLTGFFSVWGVPVIASILAWSLYAPPVLRELVVVALAIGSAAPLSVALAGSILDHACRVGELRLVDGGRSFQLLGSVLVGAVALQTAAPFELMVTVRTLAERGGGLDLLGILARVGSAVCVCGGILSVVGLGVILLIELPVRWCVSPYRVSPIDLSLGALRPLIIVATAGALFHLGGALVGVETAPRLLGGIP